jgi:hypothetical protein
MSAIVGRFLERDERVEEHRGAPSAGDQARGGGVGVARKPHEDEISRMCQRASHERRGATEVRSRVGHDVNLGTGANECLGDDPVAGVLRIEVAEVRHPQAGERRARRVTERTGNTTRGHRRAA